MHQDIVETKEGQLASYIPELANADPELFGIALVSLQGNVYHAGDTSTIFTIQSVSKPFVYAMVLAEIGLDTALSHIGAEPSGEAFNAISLNRETGRPANPMINAGAILTTSLVAAQDGRDRFDRIRQRLSAFAGRDLDVDEAVYRSELATGDRNRALAYLMRSAGALQEDVEETLDAYFRQCAVRVSTIDIAIMAATLANRGVNPVTGEHIVSATVADQVMTMMATCGMYDASGEWLLHVGLPAKSGVSGAMVAVSPGEFGIGLFSPRVDAQGNSVRGVAACRELAARFDLQLIRRTGQPAPTLYTQGLDEFAYGTTGWEPGGENAHNLPDNLVIRGPQGDICFSDAERVLRSLDSVMSRGDSGETRIIVFDLHRVGNMSRAAHALVSTMDRDLSEFGHHVTVVDDRERTLIDFLKVFPSLNDVLLWAGQAS
ncbi:MAG TPA: glutaminase A [Thermomicrobiales bacterium]|nr:glutaminase A [Thermomicrobiales bacterium]